MPVVTPDHPVWEMDYMELKDYLMTFGKEYPEETGFMMRSGREEDHVVETREEMLGEFYSDTVMHAARG